MRDILTIIAAFVILILAAALIAPPLVDWEAHRSVIDQAISRATGTEAKTDGRVGVRLLPTPRIRLDRLRLGPQNGQAPSLAADFVWAEIALTPLLRGEVRVLETRIGRADIRIPVSEDGSWRLPPDLLTAGRSRAWALENLVVAQLLLTTQVPATGRTDQFFAENMTIEAQSLIGPWRAEGTAKGVPFRLLTGELGADRTVQIKLLGGGDQSPRFDVDGRLALDLRADGTTTPAMTGRAKLFFGPPAQAAPAGVPFPLSVDAGFKTGGGAVELDPVTLDAGEGGASLRLTGTGRIGLSDPRAVLRLEGRRLDADAFLASPAGQDLLARVRSRAPMPNLVPLDLEVALGSVTLAQEELTNASVKASLSRGRLALERAGFTAPGDTRVVLSGEADLAHGGLNGRLAVTSTASDRLARILERLGLASPFASVLDGRPFEVAADVTTSAPITSFRNVRMRAGDASLTGNARFTAPESGGRGRLDAQVAVQGLNLDQLPRVASLFDATQNLDVGFILDARDVRAGNRRGAGRIAARIASDGPALLVETLDITDLAGANARVSGRIAPDGSGRIAGKVTAARAAPLVDLLGSVWIGGVAKLVPPFLREGALDLDVVTERVAPQAGSPGELRLRTTARGRAAGGGFEGEVLTADGVTQQLDLRLATDNTGRWFERPEAAPLQRPSNIALRGTRIGSGRFSLTASGDLGGVRITTVQPFVLSPADDVIDTGEAEVAAGDIAPMLMLFGEAARVQGPVPVQGRIALGREAGHALVTVNGRVANEPLQARLAVHSRSDLSGSVTLDRLSLPWLLSTLTFNSSLDAGPNAPWSGAHFGQAPPLLTGGQIAVRAQRLDLGRTLAAETAAFTLLARPDGLTLRDFEAGLGGGRLTGLLGVTRQGALASVTAEAAWRDLPLAVLAGSTPLQARLSGSVKVGASGESLAALVSNLGGSGEARLAELRVPNGDPQAVARALQRLLADENPLLARRVETVVAEELSRGALTAATIAGSLSVVNGAARLTPVAIETNAASWRGAVTYDFKGLTLDARGTLVSKVNPPRNWTGTPPSIGLAWRGPLASPVREIDAGPLSNGLASIVLQRELEKIEMFEMDANERLRRQNRLDMDRQRERDRLAALEAARQARLREEAEQRARAEAERLRLEAEQRARAEAERLRLEAEQRARTEAERQRLEAEQRAAQERAAQERAARERAAQERAAQEQANRLLVPGSAAPILPPPFDIRPPAQIERPGG